jgi:predicted nucleic acid-binding protein
VAEAFFDSNVLICLLSQNTAKARRSEELILGGGHISTQVLNETVSVLRSKLKADWTTVHDLLAFARRWCEVHSLDIAVHDAALAASERYKIHIYDASIIVSAKLAGCKALWSEDMNDGQVIEGVRIKNPF